MTKGELRVGVVGVGGIASGQHLPAWQRLPYVRLVALADLLEDAARYAAEKFHVPHTFTDWRDLIARDDLDIVDICTPNCTHAPIARAALAAGKHVLCEKPLATNVADVRAMQDAARQADKLLMAAQSFRFRSISRQLKALVDGGLLGEIYYARAQWLRRRFLPPGATFIDRQLSGGGPALDLGVHVLDLAYWLMGAPEPLSATAFVDARLAHRLDVSGGWGDWDRQRFDVEDFVAGFVRFANGATLSLEASWLAFQPEAETIRVQCYGDRGGLVWPEGVVVGETNRVPWDLRPGAGEADDAYFQEIRQFAEAVRGGLPSPVPVEQTLNVIRILEAIYQSGRQGHEVSLG